MRVLLDECVHEQLRNRLPGHECQTARYAGFASLENGELLLTVDRGFEYQQNLINRPKPEGDNVYLYQAKRNPPRTKIGGPSVNTGVAEI